MSEKENAKYHSDLNFIAICEITMNYCKELTQKHYSIL